MLAFPTWRHLAKVQIPAPRQFKLSTTVYYAAFVELDHLGDHEHFAATFCQFRTPSHMSITTEISSAFPRSISNYLTEFHVNPLITFLLNPALSSTGGTLCRFTTPSSGYIVTKFNRFFPGPLPTPEYFLQIRSEW